MNNILRGVLLAPIHAPPLCKGVCGSLSEPVFFCFLLLEVKEEAPQSRFSDTLHVDPGGLVTITTPNRLATVGVCAISLPAGKG